VVKADLTQPEQARKAVAGAAVTYQTTQPAYHRWAQEFPALQAGIVDAAAQAGSRLVILDNLYAYGDPQGGVITEQSPEHATTKKGAVRRAITKAALEAHKQGRLEVAVLRPSNYFGPGYALTESMVFGRALARKPMQWLGRKDQPHSFSYTPDVARALGTLGNSEQGWGKVWIAPVMPAVTIADFSKVAWEAAGQSGKPKVQNLRGLGLAFIALFTPVLRETKEMMFEWDQPYVVDSSAFEKAFDFTPTPFAEAMTASLAAAEQRDLVAVAGKPA
jgi:nucleoside-diphosphate-sugar epimerase